MSTFDNNVARVSESSVIPEVSSNYTRLENSRAVSEKLNQDSRAVAKKQNHDHSWNDLKQESRKWEDEIPLIEPEYEQVRGFIS